MKTKKIDGYQFHNMLLNGLANLRAVEDEINDLNVFPVPDGDTGTNMSLTIENGINNVTVKPEMGAYLKSLSEGMLLGARGNSGVILSQIFRGIFLGLSRCGYVNTLELVNGFTKGYKVAYEAVAHPAEGTILTVTREGIEGIKSQLDKNTSMESMLSLYIAEMKKSLARTPDLMPVLKEAGVVDSGALGYITIVEGMLKYLCGEIIDTKGVYGRKTDGPKPLDLSHFDENSTFDDGYCMEYILQLMKSKKNVSRFNIDKYTDFLIKNGNSVVCTLLDKRVKVHVHTHEPAKIIEHSQEFGEFLTFKLENMQLQHNEHDEKMGKNKKKTVANKTHKFIEVITVCDGEGINDIFSEFGCSCIQTNNGQNVSSNEFLGAINEANADYIVILPNNKNNIMSGTQAIEMSKLNNIHMIPTTSVIEGYFAVASDVQDSDDYNFRIKMMTQGISDIVSFAISTANKDSKVKGKTCKSGDKVGFIGDALVSTGDNVVDVFIETMESVSDIEDLESVLVFNGVDATEANNELIEERIEEKFPMMDVTFIEGDQSIYEYVVGIS